MMTFGKFFCFKYMKICIAEITLFINRILRDLENTDIPIIISSYCNVKTGELAYEDICTEPQRHNS